MQAFNVLVPAHVDNQGKHVPALELSEFVLEDAAAVSEICADAAIAKWTTVPSPYTLADAQYFIKEVAQAGWSQDLRATWAVRLDGQLVGCVSLEFASSAIGYWFAPQVRGSGVARAAVAAVIRAAFDNFDMPALYWAAEIHDGVPNWPSWRLAWSLGFKREGLVRLHGKNKGEYCDQWVGTLLAGDPLEPVAPWDGPVRGRQVVDTPLVAHDGVGEREGDDPEALVRRFHHVYGLPVLPTDAPSVDNERVHMRMSLIAEEFGELVGAVYGKRARAGVEAAFKQAVSDDDGSRDTVEAADALADLIYVIYGMALEMGIDLAKVLAEVQRSNMSKLGEDGKPIYREDGKVLKGPGYFRPDVAGVLGL